MSSIMHICTYIYTYIDVAEEVNRFINQDKIDQFVCTLYKEITWTALRKNARSSKTFHINMKKLFKKLSRSFNT